MLNFFKPSNEKIFISIASFCDDDLINTINNVIENAENKSNLVFSLYIQDSKEYIQKFPFKPSPQFHIQFVESKDSKGCCWARTKIQEKYHGEKYYLQLDAHTRLVPNWDTLCKKWLNTTGSNKPILTSYLIAFDKSKSETKEYLNDFIPYKLSVPLFYDNDKMRIEPSTIDDFTFYDKPVLAHFFSAHFVFTYGQWIKEVPYDELLYFEGEEDTLGVRSFTNGWDMYHPHRAIGYHFYTRAGEIKHHDVVDNWHLSHEQSLDRMRKILKMIHNDEHFGQYDLGNVRSIESYETLTGIQFKLRKIKGSKRNELARKKIWHYLNGNIKRVEEGKWHEYKDNQVFHEFLEVEHNEDSLLLQDKSRDIFVKIENNKAYFKQFGEEKYGDWVQFNTGTWNGDLNAQENEKQVLDRLNNSCKIINRGKFKAIISLRTPNTAEWANYAAVNQIHYAQKYNFTYILYQDLVVVQDIPHWNKVRLLMHWLPKFDYIVWIDSDAIFTNLEKQFEDYINLYPNKSLFVCNDIGGWQLNTGVMVLKNTNWMRNVLNLLWQMDHIPHSKAAEQSSLIQLLEMNDPDFVNWHVFDQKDFNCHPKSHSQGDFILHMMGLSGEERLETFKRWNNKLGINDKIKDYHLSA